MSVSRRASARSAQAGTQGRGTFAPARMLLHDYALAWAEHATRKLALQAAEADDPVEIAYLDPFAGADHPLPADLLPLSVSVLSRLLAPLRPGPSRVRAALVEEDPVKLEWLEEACRRAGLGDRAGRAAPPAEIALREDDWTTATDSWPAPLQARSALVLLDPPAARRLPLERMLAVLADSPAEMLLRFPVADLRRLAGYPGSTLADLPPYARRALEGISRLLGDARHEWVFSWRALRAEHGDTAADAAVVERLRTHLGQVTGRMVRRFEVPAEGDAAAGPEHLLLLSHDPARVLLMNEVLYAARRAGKLSWAQTECEFVRYVPRGELELFGGSGASAPGEQRERVADTLALAHGLATRFAGRRLPFRQVLQSVIETDLFEADVRRALGQLRRDRRALFRSLAADGAEVAFPRSGTTRGAARPRTTRAGEEGEDLFLPLDDGGPPGTSGR